MTKTLSVRLAGAVATVGLDRPERHNALDEQLIGELHEEIARLTQDTAVRVIVIAAQGKSFCAGADLAWMKRAALLDDQSNYADARQLAALLFAIATCSKPVVARVQGSAYGGGVGLICACDIAIGTDDAQFALTEVRLGLAAATISPYVLGAIGARQARRLTLTGERFDAAQAKAFGLLHEVVAPEALDTEVARVADALLAGGPCAQATVKDLIRRIDGVPFSIELVDQSAQALADIRASAEGCEGVAAFLEKRKPSWVAGLAPER
jgi:methylglutaconyl-CoA hydratase